jgi:hypothetical protein
MNMKHSLLTVAAAAVAVATASAGPNNTPNWGTDILHYTVQDRFTNSGVESGASASVQIQSKTQGNANLEKFDFTAKHLTPSTTYWLWSLSRGETNYSSATNFTTDARGNGRLRFQSNGHGNGNGNGNGNGHGNGNQPFPDALDPVIDLKSLAVVDVNTQTVLQADLGAPDRLQILVKRKLEGTNDTAGLLRIEGTLKKIHFDLQVLNLAPTNDYWLAINGAVVETTHSDSRGRLRINKVTTPANSPLDIYQVQLLDTSTNVVLGTQLP